MGVGDVVKCDFTTSPTRIHPVPKRKVSFLRSFRFYQNLILRGRLARAAVMDGLTVFP